MPSFATYTLGCKVNQAETSEIENFLLKQGYTQVDFKSIADFYLINTCSVTHVADRKSRMFIRQARKRNSQAKVIVTGCAVDNKYALGKLDVDEIIPNKTKLDLKKWQTIFPANTSQRTSHVSRLTFHQKIRKMLKIQDGCSTYCTYCIVPYLRSEKHSLPIPEIITTASNWVNNGTREIVLTGVNLGNYHWQNHSLLDVLQKLSKLDNLARIRISSLELPDVSVELINEIKLNPKICKHLHLPLQSGSAKILQAMHRPYSLQEFKQQIKKIYQAIPGLALTTDIIVGFPGESAEDFQETINTVKELNFSKLHVFIYSPRPGTPATKMDKQVKPLVASKRSKELIALGKTLEKQFAQVYLNKPCEILIEEENQQGSKGVTSTYIKIQTTEKNFLGKLVTVVPNKFNSDNSLLSSY